MPTGGCGREAAKEAYKGCKDPLDPARQAGIERYRGSSRMVLIASLECPLFHRGSPFGAHLRGTSAALLRGTTGKQVGARGNERPQRRTA